MPTQNPQFVAKFDATSKAQFTPAFGSTPAYNVALSNPTASATGQTTWSGSIDVTYA